MRDESPIEGSFCRGEHLEAPVALSAGRTLLGRCSAKLAYATGRRVQWR